MCSPPRPLASTGSDELSPAEKHCLEDSTLPWRYGSTCRMPRPGGISWGAPRARDGWRRPGGYSGTPWSRSCYNATDVAQTPPCAPFKGRTGATGGLGLGLTLPWANKGVCECTRAGTPSPGPTQPSTGAAPVIRMACRVRAMRTGAVACAWPRSCAITPSPATSYDVNTRRPAILAHDGPHGSWARFMPR